MMGGTWRRGAFAGFSFADSRNWENEGCSSSIAAIWMIHYMIVLDWTPRSMQTADADFLLWCHSPFSISVLCVHPPPYSGAVRVKYYRMAEKNIYLFSCSDGVEVELRFIYVRLKKMTEEINIVICLAEHFVFKISQNNLNCIKYGKKVTSQRQIHLFTMYIIQGSTPSKLFCIIFYK